MLTLYWRMMTLYNACTLCVSWPRSYLSERQHCIPTQLLFGFGEKRQSSRVTCKSWCSLLTFVESTPQLFWNAEFCVSPVHHNSDWSASKAYLHVKFLEIILYFWIFVLFGFLYFLDFFLMMMVMVIMMKMIMTTKMMKLMYRKCCDWEI